MLTCSCDSMTFIWLFNQPSNLWSRELEPSSLLPLVLFWKSNEQVQTSFAFWQSAHVLASELSPKWHRFKCLLVQIKPISEKHVCDGRTVGPTDGRTDGRTNPLIQMRERIYKDIVQFLHSWRNYCFARLLIKCKLNFLNEF